MGNCLKEAGQSVEKGTKDTHWAHSSLSWVSSELKFELHSEERETFKILAGNENDIIRKDESDMCALGGKKASSETSDETSVVIKGTSFCPFCLLFW